MSVFSEAALEKKLAELSNSQQSVQTLALWLIHHRKHSRSVVSVWYKELRKAKSTRKLTFIYLANDAIQNSKRKGPEFTRDFAPFLIDGFRHVAKGADDCVRRSLDRVLQIWQERVVYEAEFLEEIRRAVHGDGKPVDVAPKKHVMVEERIEKGDERRKDTGTDKKAMKRNLEQTQKTKEKHRKVEQQQNNSSTETEELLHALTELEQAASSDAAVCKQIATLPLEVQDTTQLSRVTDREAAERLAQNVEEACVLLADYSGRLAAELEDRRQLAGMLTTYAHAQRELLTIKEAQLDECKQKLSNVAQVRKELRVHMQSLTDPPCLPKHSQNLAPLPSPGDLFSKD
uniref:regulation of nuclear pre-mRNA domain-containing protein 1B-like n=1 Tax=Myxine glutinosa TaxID=7769 RepID=UPI00358F1253